MSEKITQTLTNDHEANVPRQQRRIVSYFDHVFMDLSYDKVERDVDEMLDAGFSNVVLCMTEKDIASRSRLVFLKDAVAYMRSNDLDVWTDLWSVGGVFGGEGGSAFSDSGEARHMGNPNLDGLILRGLDAAASIDAKTIFWDEPEMKDSRKYLNKEVEFLEKYTAAAGRLALKSVVCLCADEARVGQLDEVASMPDVIEIATDPYFPNPFPYRKITEKNRLKYIERWVDYTRRAADKAGVNWHIWMQDFAIPKDRLIMIDENVDVLLKHGVESIAVWGFGGCESVPDFANDAHASPRESWQRVKDALSRIQSSHR